jgi:hypothetical protein
MWPAPIHTPIRGKHQAETATAGGQPDHSAIEERDFRHVRLGVSREGRLLLHGHLI